MLFPAALVQDWPAYADLVRDGAVDWAALSERYGDHNVPVVIGEGDVAKPEDMALRDAVQLIQRSSQTAYIKDWHLVRTARTDARARQADDTLARRMPYRTPFVFADDWMNNVTPPAAPSDTYAYTPDAWLASDSHTEFTNDDFRFCYAGTARSSTPLHRDGTPLA